MCRCWRVRLATILLILSSFTLISCTSRPRLSDAPQYRHISKRDPKSGFYEGQTWIGMASYYAEDYHGKKTASGATFDMNGLTTAHRYLPFGTVIRVVNLKNRKSIKLEVNDRGPFINGRILDVSKGAAQKLDMIQDGVVEVQITILTLP